MVVEDVVDLTLFFLTAYAVPPNATNTVAEGWASGLSWRASEAPARLLDEPITEKASPGVGIYAAGVGGALVAYGRVLLAGWGIWPGGAQAPPADEEVP